MDIAISCMDRSIPIRLPDEAQVAIVEQPHVPALEHPRGAVEQALESPVASPRLRALAGKYRRAIILVTDYTRILPYPTLLPPLLEEIAAAGIPRENTCFLVASGTHRPMTQPELEAHLGPAITGAFSIYPHRWWEPSQLVYLGKTANGTPITVNKLLAEDALLVGVGTVKPHRDAGWSGGAKIIQPGVCGMDTTGATHWLAAQFPCEEILGEVDNPVRREMEAIAQQAGLDFILNCVQDSCHNIAFVAAGHPVGAHRACVAFARDYFTVPFREEADIFLAGSSPVQQSMWSLGSGPNWAKTMLRRGGHLIQAGRCPQGICPEHPEVEAFGYLPLNTLRQLVDAGRITDLAAASHLHHGGEKIYEKDISVGFYCPDLTGEQIRRLGFAHSGNLQQLLDAALEQCGPSPRVAVYPGYDFATLIPKAARQGKTAE